MPDEKTVAVEEETLVGTMSNDNGPREGDEILNDGNSK